MCVCVRASVYRVWCECTRNMVNMCVCLRAHMNMFRASQRTRSAHIARLLYFIAVVLVCVNIVFFLSSYGHFIHPFGTIQVFCVNFRSHINDNANREHLCLIRSCMCVQLCGFLLRACELNTKLPVLANTSMNKPTQKKPAGPFAPSVPYNRHLHIRQITHKTRHTQRSTQKPSRERSFCCLSIKNKNVSSHSLHICIISVQPAKGSNTMTFVFTP